MNVRELIEALSSLSNQEAVVKVSNGGFDTPDGTSIENDPVEVGAIEDFGSWIKLTEY